MSEATTNIGDELDFWFKIVAFNELSGDGVYRAEIGALSEALGYTQDSDDMEAYQPTVSTFPMEKAVETFVWWVNVGAFETSIRQEIYLGELGVDPLIDCLMHFIASQEVQHDYFGLNPNIKETDANAIATHMEKYGFGADLTWRFTRDPLMSNDDLHEFWHILKSEYPDWPV